MYRPVTISKRTIMILAVCLISIVASSCDGDPGPAPRRALRFQQVSSATTVPLTPAATPDISATISAAFPANTQPRGQAPVIPADVRYSVIQTNIVTGIRKSIDVRLDKEVSEDALRAIAVELKSGDSRHYERTFIVYYLPEMPVGGGGWATTHFDPGLEVRILGLAGQEERADAGRPLAARAPRRTPPRRVRRGTARAAPPAESGAPRSGSPHLRPPPGGLGGPRSNEGTAR